MPKPKLVVNNQTDGDRIAYEKQIVARLREQQGPSTIMTITPGMAELILQNLYGDHNRKPIEKTIRKVLRGLQQNRFYLTGETITFTTKGVLGDGQNRLFACIRAGKAITVHVVFGVEHEAFPYINTGQSRTAAHVLRIARVANPEEIAPAVRWAELLDTGRAVQRTTFEPDEILALYRKHHSDLNDHHKAAKAVHSVYHKTQPVGAIMAALAIFHRIDTDVAADFEAAWGSGTYPERFIPIREMQAAMTELAEATNGRIHDVARMALIVMAWNAVRKGKTMTRARFKWTRGSIFPAIDGHTIRRPS